MSVTWFDAVGIAGTVMIAATYLATQLRRLSSDELAFPLLNLIGALLILVSLSATFNLASALMEGFWIAISLVGIRRWWRERGAP
jgi:hypothetical protein